MYDSYTLDQAPYGEWKATTDQTNSSHPPRSQKQPEFQRGQSRTIYLPAERTGAVIGKNGRMKHLIKEVCNVWMSIKSEPFELDNSKRVCVIRGPTTDNLDHAESLINELLRDRETIEKSIALNTSDDVGRVIGSGGSNIQVIKDKTGAFVYVDKENVPAQYAGRCIIRGNSVQVQAAEKRVLELLARRDLNILEQCIAARNNQTYAKQIAEKAQHQQQQVNVSNGGMSNSQPNGQSIDQKNHGLWLSGHSPVNHTSNAHDDTLPKSVLANNSQSGMSMLNDTQNGQIGIWPNGTDQWTNQKEVEKELEKHAKKRIQDTILIPLNAVGMVIGKKGKNIKIIQETSGANVYIDKEYTGIDDNALCVIHGKVEQVDIAKEMIHEKLHQYNSANTFPIMDSSGSLIEHGSPPSDTRSDGSTGITYSSPVGPGSSNSLSPPHMNSFPPQSFNYPPPNINGPPPFLNSGVSGGSQLSSQQHHYMQLQQQQQQHHSIQQKPQPVGQQHQHRPTTGSGGNPGGQSYNQFSLGLENLTINVSARNGAGRNGGGSYNMMDHCNISTGDLDRANVPANAAQQKGDFFFNQQTTKPAIGFWNN